MLMNSLEKLLNENNFQFFYIDNTTSTMDVAKSKINSIKNNFIILSKEQTRGRGRRGNQWISLFGNIYCSIVLSLNIPLSEYFKIGMMTSVAVKSSLEHIGIRDILFKWPNDIYCDQKKIAGIIQESVINKFNNKFLIIGLGINFLSSPILKNYKTTHIFKYVKNIKLDQYFEVFVNYFFHYFKGYIFNNNTDFVTNYKKSQVFLNEIIKVRINEKKILKGVFKGINDDGSLILQKKNDQVLIYSGQIIL